jgi:cell division protein FtsB
MDKNTGTDNVVRRLSGADTIGEQADEIAALRAENEQLRDDSLRKRMASGERFYTLSPDDLGRIVAERVDTLRARIEALEAFVQDLADESCLDRGSHRNQEACGETNLRLIDYCGPCRARALLEQKP